MCNLYTNRKSAAEIAAHFRAQMPINFNAPDAEVYPGYPGLVVRESDGLRVVEKMTWGYPLSLKSKKDGSPLKPKPVNNIAAVDRFPWKFIASKPVNRCIIPLTGFCEAEGAKGAMTRTWLSVKDQPIFAWAGMWDDSKEWGHWYSGFMTDCNEAIRPIHTRMPVLLHEEDYELWLHGSLTDVIALQERCFPDELIVINRTGESWFKRKAVAAEPEPSRLL